MEYEKKGATIASVLFVLVAIGGLIYIYTNHRNEQAEIQSQIQEQNRELELQDKKIKEQEEIEAARIEEKQKQKRAADAAQREADHAALNYEYEQAITSLRVARIELDEIQRIVKVTVRKTKTSSSTTRSNRIVGERNKKTRKRT